MMQHNVPGDLQRTLTVDTQEVRCDYELKHYSQGETEMLRV